MASHTHRPDLFGEGNRRKRVFPCDASHCRFLCDSFDHAQRHRESRHPDRPTFTYPSEYRMVSVDADWTPTYCSRPNVHESAYRGTQHFDSRRSSYGRYSDSESATARGQRVYALGRLEGMLDHLEKAFYWYTRRIDRLLGDAFSRYSRYEEHHRNLPKHALSSRPAHREAHRNHIRFASGTRTASQQGGFDGKGRDSQRRSRQPYATDEAEEMRNTIAPQTQATTEHRASAGPPRAAAVPPPVQPAPAQQTSQPNQVPTAQGPPPVYYPYIRNPDRVSEYNYITTAGQQNTSPRTAANAYDPYRYYAYAGQQAYPSQPQATYPGAYYYQTQAYPHGYAYGQAASAQPKQKKGRTRTRR